MRARVYVYVCAARTRVYIREERERERGLAKARGLYPACAEYFAVAQNCKVLRWSSPAERERVRGRKKEREKALRDGISGRARCQPQFTRASSSSPSSLYLRTRDSLFLSCSHCSLFRGWLFHLFLARWLVLRSTSLLLLLLLLRTYLLFSYWVSEGVDPIAEKEKEREREVIGTTRSVYICTFGICSGFSSLFWIWLSEKRSTSRESLAGRLFGELKGRNLFFAFSPKIRARKQS